MSRYCASPTDFIVCALCYDKRLNQSWKKEKKKAGKNEENRYRKGREDTKNEVKEGKEWRKGMK